MHDLFIKQAMSEPNVAREFFESYLPPHIRQKIDLRTLEAQKDSFIENSLGVSYVDLLFKVKFGQEDGYLYILVEQQSKPDRMMPLRLQRYMLQICSKHIEKHHGSKYLPLVYPLVFYTGKDPYNTPLTLWELFRDAALARSCFVEPFRLIELHKIEDDELREHMWSGVMAFLMKHIYERDILQFLSEIRPSLEKIARQNIIYIEDSLWYILKRAESSDADAVVEFFKEIVPEEKRGNIMTIEEMLIEKGAKLGEERGELRGIRLGEERGIRLGEQRGIRLGEQRGEERGIRLGEQRGIQIGELKVNKFVHNM
ncbi:MAG: Rpn family recombination-promoting nuclease/putative transposase, partial [Rickettsiales bacterium]